MVFKKMHHMGMVIDDIEKYASIYSKLFGLKELSPVIEDPIQKVHIKFLGDTGTFLLELIQPVGEGSTVSSFLKKGGGFNHICYEVDNIELAIKEAVANGGILVKGPDPAVAFDGRCVAFVIFRETGIVEFVEAVNGSGSKQS